MPESPENVLMRYLEPAEQLLWSGRPRVGIRFRRQDAFLIPFSIIMCLMFVVAMRATATANPHRANGFQTNIPILAAIGVYALAGRFIVDAWSRSRTFYGVTRERVVIVSGTFSVDVKTIQLRTLSDLTMIQKSDGTGTITFGLGSLSESFMQRGLGRRYTPPCFDMIERVKEIYDLIRGAQKGATKSAR